MGKVIGVFGGSYNPIHIGHLALANYLCEYHSIDEMWFLVTPLNPLKSEKGMLNNRIRLEMVQASIEGYDKFIASDFEFGLPIPSYTVDTLRALREKYPENKFVLIIGADNWAIFKKWKNPEEIIRNHDIIIYKRPGYNLDVDCLPSGVAYANTPELEISSTFIRESVCSGRDVRYYVHPNVWKIICERGLYK